MIDNNIKLAEIGQLINKGVAEVMPHTVCKGRYQSNHCNVVNSPGDIGCVLKYYCQRRAELQNWRGQGK